MGDYTMKAGFSVTDITPRVGVALYGFGAYINRNSKAIRDRLEARAAAFESGGKRVVVIGCDLCTINPRISERARAMIREAHPELEDRDILINTSHTHSSPSTTLWQSGWGFPDRPYLELLPGRIARAGINALDALEEVEYSFAEVPCEHIGVNRIHDIDHPELADALKPDWRPDKPELTDTSCRVLKFTRGDGTLAGFIAHFGCHPVVGSASNTYIHGDYPALAIHELMREFPGSVGVFLQGAEGDVNSCVVHQGEQESLLALDVIAGRFANAVRNGLAAAKPVADTTVKSAAKVAKFTPDDFYSVEELERLYAEKLALFSAPDASDDDKKLRSATTYLDGIEMILTALKRGEQPGTEVLVQGIRLGPAAILGSPFETMQGIRRDVDKAAKAPVPLVTSLCNYTLGYASDRVARSMTTGGANYSARRVPCISGRLPLKYAHEELAQALLDIDAELAK